MDLLRSQFKFFSVVLAIAAAFGQGCAKQRPAALPDGGSETIFAVSALQGSRYELVLSSKALSEEDSDARRVRAAHGFASYEVEQVKALGQGGLEPLFRGLVVSGRPAERVIVSVSLDRSYLTVSRWVADAAEISSLERAISLASADSAGVRVPLFQVAITRFGTLVRTKNETGGETATLRLKDSAWDQATHIELGASGASQASRRMVDFDEETREQYFDRKLFEGQQIKIRTGKASLLTTILKSEKRVVVAHVDAPKRLQAIAQIFQGLPIQAPAEREYAIQFSVERDSFTAYRVITSEQDRKELSPEQYSIALKSEDSQDAVGAPLLIPLLQFAIDAHGVVEQAKDEFGSPTPRLKLREASLEAATHVAFRAVSSRRLEFRCLAADCENVFPRALFSGTNERMSTIVVKARTQAKPIEVPASDLLRSRAHGKRFLLDPASIEAPEAIRGWFKNLAIEGSGDTQYRFLFDLDPHFVSVYRSRLSAEDDVIFERNPSLVRKQGLVKYMMVFQYPILTAGRLERTLDSHGYPTHALTLKRSEWSKATHFRVSPLTEDRSLVRSADARLEDEIFSRSAVDSRVLSAEEVKRYLGVSLAGAESVLYYIRVDGRSLHFYEILPLGGLSAEQLAKSKSISCAEASQSIAAAGHATSPSLGGPSCQTRLKFTVPVTYVEARYLRVPQEMTRTAEYEYVGVNASAGSNLIRIAADVVPLRAGVEEYDTRWMLPVSQVRGRQFLFRRTVLESPNSFSYMFAGQSGNLEIVSFRFEEEGVRILRADPLLALAGSTDVDRETLMRFQASYVRKETSDAAGNSLSAPVFVKTDFEDPQAIAVLDWSKNQIPNVSSALEYYGLEQCFQGPPLREVSDVDSRLGEGMLNFTLSSTYAASTNLDCAGLSSADYFDKVQANFTFNERVSLKEYKPGDEKPLLELPYEAQKRLGFGFFTYSKATPNSSGSLDVDGTKTPLPALFDLRKGQKIQYVLAGLPESGELRDSVIRATREVIDDVNRAFEKAIGRSDVVTLQIEGVDVEPRKLGDLDRNYIYFLQKKTASNVIGLGGAHSNPRSGAVEAASVFIYGGNIQAAVESYRKREVARETYHANVKIEPIPESNQLKVTPPSSTPTPGPITAEVIVKGDQDASSKDVLVGPEAISPYGVRPLPFKTASGSLTLKQVKSTSLTSAGVSQSYGYEEIARLRRMIRPEQLAVLEGIEDARRSGRLGDARSVELSVLSSQIKRLKGRVSEETYSGIRSRYVVREAANRVLGKLRTSGMCVYEADDLETSLKSLSKQTDLEAFVAIYKPTLAHEIGHNLGLRHNFIGSFDAAHFKFTSEDGSRRDYSSIMDYLANDHETYDGFGPQDVAALRAGYAGRVELQDGQIVSISELLPMIGKKSWLNVSTAEVSKLPIKKYLFCSDEDAGRSPTCYRFDQGTTPEEIVLSYADNYKALYALTNFPGDKLSFGQADTGAYVGRLFSTLVPARQMLEETYYQAFFGDQSSVQSFVGGAVKALFLFHEIARAPELTGTRDSDFRFALRAQVEGGEFAAERKLLGDVPMDDVSDRLAVRGIELDKVVATILLTQRDMGFPRYEQESLRLSFPMLEKELGISFDPDSPDELLTLSLLREQMLEKVTPMATLPGTGEIMALDSRFRTGSTEMIRIYSILGALVNSDVQGLDAGSNFSMLFRVLSGYPKSVPAGALNLAQPGVDLNEPNELRFWTSASALASRKVLSNASVWSTLSRDRKDLQSMVAQWISYQFDLQEVKPEDLEAIKLVQSKLQELEKVFDERLRGHFPDTTQSLRAIGQFALVVINRTTELSGQAMDPIEVDAFQVTLENLGKAQPLRALALEGIEPQSVAKRLSSVPEEQAAFEEAFGKVLPRPLIDSQYGFIFSNIETMNRIFYDVHPEYSK